MSKKNDSFSFDNDPGKMADKEDADFTFADIPVLGNEKKKEAFSLDQITDDSQGDPTIASFEALLSEQPKPEEGSNNPEDEVATPDASASTIDIQRVINARDAKKKKRLPSKCIIEPCENAAVTIRVTSNERGSYMSCAVKDGGAFAANAL